MRNLLGPLLLLMLVATPSYALSLPLTQDSVERMAQESHGIVRVRIDRRPGDISAHVIERLKGDVPDAITLPDEAASAGDGDQYLVFLQDYARDIPASAPNRPKPTWVPQVAHDLAGPIDATSFADGPLTGPRLIQLVREEIRRPPNTTWANFNYTSFPLDERFYALAHRRMDSPDPRRRAAGIAALNGLARPEDLARIRTFVHDPAGEPSGRGRDFHIYYPVRYAAAEVLRRAGERVDDIVFSEPNFNPVKRPHLALAAVPPAGLLLLMFLLCDRRRAQTPTTRLCGLLAAVCLVVAVLGAGLWGRSLWRVDHVLIYSKERRLELTSSPHGVQLLRFETSETPTPMVVRTAFAPGTDRDQLWRIDILNPSTEHSVAGARYARGGFHRNGHLIEPAWVGVRIAYAWVIGLSLGAFVLLRFTAGRLRMRGFHKYGLCPSCGYDLRAATGVCPECAWAVPTT